MSNKKDVTIQTCRVIKVVDPKLAAKIQDFQCRLGAIESGYPVITDWHPVIPEGWGQFPEIPFERSVIYRGSAESWAYSHHQTIMKFKDKYVASWSNGFLHEDYIGQEVHCAWSSDGMSWSEPQIVAHTPVESKLVRNNAGLYSANGRLYCLVGVSTDPGRDVAEPGMSVLKEPPHLDVYETTDLKTWKPHENVCENIYLFEGPRKTKDGKFLCCGFDLSDHHARVLIWNDPSKPTERPQVVDIPISPEGVLPEQGTWYQTDDGRIWMYQRDASANGYLASTWSDNEGQTWSDLLRTDFPNTYCRVFAGQLNDGRFYIVGNNYNRFLDRNHLHLALSDDGYVFDRQYTLVEGQTTRRVNGRHKENGYHYPNCCVDGDKLLVIHSENKEDIVVGVVDMSKVD